MKSYGTDELTKIIGCHWCDPAIQRLFASHFVKKYSTTIIRDPIEQEKTYIAPPFPIASRLYVSPCKNVIIETNLDKRLAMTIESVICAYVNVKKGGGSAGIKMPGDLHLPETPEECCRRFKCRYSQSSRDGKRLLLCCQGGTFLFIENKLDQACFYGEDRTSGSIYDLKFNE